MLIEGRYHPEFRLDLACRQTGKPITRHPGESRLSLFSSFNSKSSGNQREDQKNWTWPVVVGPPRNSDKLRDRASLPAIEANLRDIERFFLITVAIVSVSVGPPERDIATYSPATVSRRTAVNKDEIKTTPEFLTLSVFQQRWWQAKSQW